MNLIVCNVVLVLSVCFVESVFGQQPCLKCAGVSDCDALVNSRTAFKSRGADKLQDIVAGAPETVDLFKLISNAEFDDPAKSTHCFTVKFATNAGLESEIRGSAPEKIGSAPFCDYIKEKYEVDGKSGVINDCLSCKGINCNLLADPPASEAPAGGDGAAPAGGETTTKKGDGTTSKNNTALPVFAKNAIYSTIACGALFNLLH